MAIDEQRIRQSLQSQLTELFGGEETALLMHYLPPVGWADVATKRDLDSLAGQLRTEIAALRSDLRGEIAQLRGEMHSEIAELRGEMHSDIAELRGEMRSEIAELRGELKAQTTRMLLWLVPTVLAGMGVAARIG